MSIIENNLVSKPLVSIIIPLYNAEKYIGVCLESVFAQTYKPIEVIVVDDGSTDSGLGIVDRYPSVRVVSQKNQGAGIARNNGVNLANGDYVAFQDADDLWYKDKLEKQMKVFLAYPELSVVSTEMQTIAENGEEIKSDRKITIHIDTPTNFYSILLSEGNVICLSSSIVKRKDFLSIGSFRDIRISQDYDFWIRLAAEGNLFYFISQKFHSFYQG